MNFSLLPKNIRDFFLKHPFWKFYTLWVLILAVTAKLSEGWMQPDEQARVLEPAHFIAYGLASLPWELSADKPIISWLLGTVFSPILRLTKWLNFDGRNEAALMRFLFGCLASTRFFALWKIFEKLKLKQTRRVFYLLVMMFAVFGPIFLVRTSQENLATTMLIWAFYLALKMNAEGFTKGRGLCFGVLLAFTASTRPQLGLASAGLGLWQLRRHGWGIVGPAACGLFIGLLPLAVVDQLTTHHFFSPAFNYLSYALGDENGGRTWGTSPWWFYLTAYFESWYPPLSIIFAVPLMVGVFLTPSLAVVIVPFLVAHFILGHKETRYFSPMIPFFQIGMFLGLEHLEARSRFWNWLTSLDKFWLRLLKFIGTLTLLAGFWPINSSPWMYQAMGRQIREGSITHFSYIGNTMTSFSQFYSKMPPSTTYTKYSWDDVRDGHATPQGWLAFYCLDPEDYFRIQEICGNKGFYQYQDWFINTLMLAPRSPARRKLNPIIYCPLALNFSKLHEPLPKSAPGKTP